MLVTEKPLQGELSLTGPDGSVAATSRERDGSAWMLTLRDVIDRAVDLEMAYNPNDCVELRWGAPAKSDEASTCKRYAPAAQREKMSKYRAWFHERRRPPRA